MKKLLKRLLKTSIQIMAIGLISYQLSGRNIQRYPHSPLSETQCDFKTKNPLEDLVLQTAKTPLYISLTDSTNVKKQSKRHYKITFLDELKREYQISDNEKRVSFWDKPKPKQEYQISGNGKRVFIKRHVGYKHKDPRFSFKQDIQGIDLYYLNLDTKQTFKVRKRPFSRKDSESFEDFEEFTDVYSYDGNNLVFSNEKGNNLFYVDLDKKEALRVTFPRNLDIYKVVAGDNISKIALKAKSSSRKYGGIFLFDFKTLQLEQINALTKDPLHLLDMSRDSKKIIYREGDNSYLKNIETGEEINLTLTIKRYNDSAIYYRNSPRYPSIYFKKNDSAIQIGNYLIDLEYLANTIKSRGFIDRFIDKKYFEFTKNNYTWIFDKRKSSISLYLNKFLGERQIIRKED